MDPFAMSHFVNPLAGLTPAGRADRLVDPNPAPRSKKRGRKRKMVKRKKPAENFFERVKLKDLKVLLRLCHERVTGTKAEIIQRLIQHPFMGQFANEPYSGRVSRVTSEVIGQKEGIHIDAIKNMLHERGLKTTGKKIELIIRLAKGRYGMAEPEDFAKNVERDSFGRILVRNGKAVYKERKVSLKRTPISKLRERVRKKCTVDKTNWSDYRYKTHATLVCRLIGQLLKKEAFTKKMVENKDPDSMEIARECMEEFLHNQKMGAVSGLSYSGWSFDAVYEIEKILDAMCENLSDADLTKHETWMKRVDQMASRFQNDQIFGKCREKIALERKIRSGHIPRPRNDGASVLLDEEKRQKPDHRQMAAQLKAHARKRQRWNELGSTGTIKFPL